MGEGEGGGGGQRGGEGFNTHNQFIISSRERER